MQSHTDWMQKARPRVLIFYPWPAIWRAESGGPKRDGSTVSGSELQALDFRLWISDFVKISKTIRETRKRTTTDTESLEAQRPLAPSA